MTNIQFQSGAINPGDCVSNAWELVKRNLGLYIGTGLVTILMISCIPFVNFFLIGPMMGGFAYIVLRDMRDEPVEFGMLFKGFEKFAPLMVVGIIQAIPAIIFQIIQWTVDLTQVAVDMNGSSGNFYQSSETSPLQTGLVFGMIIIFLAYFVFQIIWNAVLIFAIPLIIENDIGIVDAIKTSLSAVFRNIGGIIVLMILGGLVGLLGVLVFCVGIFVAIPVTFAANVFAYRQVFPMINQQRFNMAPPPPSEYGFGGGNYT